MTAIIMLSGLALYLINKKWSRIALICLAIVCAVLVCFGVSEGVSGYAMLIGIVLIAASPVIEYLADMATAALGERLTSVQVQEISTEEDILDNRTKWRLIIAGYVVFILFAVFSIISIIRLNAKINTLYGFTQDLDQRIEDVSGTKQ
ncbi:MAG: hypothetical protein IJT96_01260 [Lachnospiraceae bacterium]|nr:hypothetical protein [Lachnospiraceae bacterium]